MESKKHTVLYIENAKNDSKAFVETFKKEVNVITCSSFKQGSEILNSKDIHLIVLDQEIILLEDVQFLKEVKNKFPNIETILLTPDISNQLLKKAESSINIRRYIAKPLKFIELKVTINNALKAYQLKRENESLLNELKSRIEKIEQMMDTAIDAIIVVNHEHKIIEANQAAVKMFGYSIDELIGNSLSILIPGDKAEMQSRHIKSFSKENNKTRYMGYGEPLYGVASSGKKIPIEVSLSKQKAEEGFNYNAFIRDISGRIEKEKELKESTAKLNEAQQIAKVGHWFYDIINEKYSWSSEVFRILEFVPGEVEESSKNLYSKIHPDDRERVRKYYYDSLKTKQIYNLNYRLKLTDGQIKYINEKCVTKYDEQGNPISSIGTFQDVTEVTIAKQELQQSEDRFKQLFQGLGDAAYVTEIGGVNRGQILEANLAASRQTGYTRDELLKMNVINDLLISGSGGMTVDELEEKLNKEGLITITEKKRRKDGTEFWDETIVTTIDFKGKPACLGINHDITERVKSEAILKEAKIRIEESEKQFRELFEKSGDAILIIKNENFIDCNQATIDMLKYKKKEDFLNTHPSVLSPKLQPDGKKSIEKANEMMQLSLKNGTHRFEWMHTRSDGEIFPVEVLLTAITNQPNNKVIHCVWRDITLRKKSEETLTKLNTAINNSINEVYIFDAESLKFSYVNNGAIQNLGYTIEELNNITPVNIKPEYNYKSFVKALAPLKKGTINKLQFETNHLRKNKTTYPVDVNLSTFKLNNKLHYLSLIVDVTKQKEEEQSRLKEVEVTNHFLNESQSMALLGYYTYDFDTKYWNASKSISNLMELKGEEGSFQVWINMIHPEDKSILIDAMSIREKNNEIPLDVIYRVIIESDGSIRWIHHISRALKKDDQGNLLPTIGVIQDITQQKLIEQELKNNQIHLEKIVEERTNELTQEKIFSEAVINNLPGIFFLFDKKGKLLRWNKNNEDVTGYSAEEFKQLTLFDFFSSEAKIIAIKQLEKFKKTNKTNFEVNIKTKLGQEIPYFISGLKIVIDTQEYIVGTGVDIAERKKGEAMLIKQSEELALFNEIMIDREMRIIEIKEEINAISKQFGEEPPYEEVWKNN